MQIKQSSKLLDDMATTFKNTVRYGISSSVFNNLSNSIQKAYNYTKALDTSLNDIRIITGYSADEMEKFAVSANRVAKDLGRSTKDFTEASLIYYQQGLGAEEAQARAEVTLKAANVTGQTGREVSEQLTAVWNGYKVTAEEAAELYVDKLAAVAAATAADLEELSTGMSKVASAANLMGVDVDQLNAQLATIVSVTRQAPESVGVALKTIYARMSDIKSGLDDETTLGNYTEKMAQYGINVLDANGKLRDMGKVIEEIGGKWNSLSREQQIALSQVMAGTRQYNNLLSLFDNWDQYEKALETSTNAAGTLQKQQDIYMESTEAHLQKLRTEAERTYDVLFDQDSVNSFADTLTSMLSVFNNFLEGIGGGTSAVVFFGSTFANIFNKQIGSAIERQIENIEMLKANQNALQMKELVASNILQNHNIQGESIGSAGLEAEAEIAQRLLAVKEALTDQDYNELTALQSKIGLQTDQIEYLQEYKTIAEDFFGSQNASIKQFERMTESLNKQLEIEEEIGVSLERDLRQYQLRSDMSEDEKTLLYNKVRQLGTIADTEDKINTLREMRFKIASGDKLSEEEITVLLKEQENYLNLQKEQTERIRQGLEGRKAAEQGLTQELIRQRDAEQDYVDKKVALAERQQAISGLVQGFTSLISLGTMLSGVIDTINDSTATTEDKIKRILPVVLMSLPIIIKNISSLSKLLPNLATALGANQTSTSKMALSLGQVNKAALSSTISIGGLTVSLGTLLLTAGAVSLALGLIAAVIIDNNKRAQEGQRQIKALQDAAQQFKEEAEEIKDTIDNIKSAFDQYDSILKSLIQCKKGTEEWNEALEKANDYIIELLQKYPELAQMDNLLKQQDGYMTYDKNVLNQYLNQLKQSQRIEATAAIQTQSRANQRKAEVDIESFSNRVAMPYYMNNINAADAKSIGTNYMTQLANAAAVSTEADWYQKELLKIRDNMIETNRSTEQSAQTWYNMMLNHKDYENTLRTLGKNLKAANKAADNTSKVLAAELLGENANAINTKALSQRIEEAKKSQTTMFTDVGAGAGKDSKTYKEALRVMNQGQETGRYQVAPQSNVIQGGQGSLSGRSRHYYFYDTQTGKTVDKSGTYLNQTYDSLNLLEEVDINKINNNIDSLLTTISKSSGLDNDLLKNILSDSFDVNELTQEQYESLKKQKERLYQTLNPDKDILKNIGNNTFTSLTEGMQANLTDGSLALLGIESYKEWEKGFNEKMGERDEALAAANMKKRFDESIAAQAEKMKEKYELDEQDFIDYATHLSDIAADKTADAGDKLADTMEKNSKATSIVAKSIMRMNKGIDELANNWKDWSSILKKSSASSLEYSKALNGMRDALGDVLDIEEDAQKYFTNKFIQEHLKEIKKVAEGDAKAIDDLRSAFAKQVIVEIYAENHIDMSKLSADVQSSLDYINKNIPKVQVGYEITADDKSYAKFLENCQNVVNSAKMTEEQANEYFASMGFEAEYETKSVPMEKTGHQTITTTEVAETNTIPTVDGGTFTYPSKTITTTTQGEPYCYTEYQDITSMGVQTPDGKGRAPKIKTLTKKGTGSMNNYSSSNKGGTAKPGGKSGGSGKKGKSGGSGKKGKSGGSKKDPDKMDPIKNEEDRYHQVDIQLKLIENDLQKIERAKEKAFGKAKIELLNKELAKYNDQINKLNNKIKIAQGETNELRKKLASQGVKFGADGAISNYVAAIQAQENAVNKLIDKYNKMSASKQEKYKDTVEKQKENFEEFKKNIDRYDELISSTIPDLQENIQDAIDKQIDIQIEEFDMEIEIRLNLKDAKQDWNQFRKEVLEDFAKDNPIGDLFKDYEDLKTLLAEDNNGLAQSLGRQLENTLNELYKMDKGKTSDVYGADRVKALEDLKKYLDESIAALEEIEDLEDAIHEDFINNMDAIQDRFDKQIDDYETISKLLEHDKEVIELVSGDDAYKQLSRFYDEQDKNYKQQLAFQNQQVIFWRKQLDTIDKSSDEWAEAKEKWQDAVDEYNDLIESSIENLQDKYLNTIKDIFNDLNNRLSGGRGLEGMNDQWQLLNMQSEEYLDNVNGIYKTQELANKYLDAIDNTNNIKAQQRLKDIMDDELANLRSRDKLSEYDLQRAELKYQIAVKQIALEEAQQNKSKMRLRRDTQGNYRYEYVADDDQLNKTKQEISDFYNQLYNLDAKKYSENLEKVYNLTKEAEEKIQELYENTTLTNEERQERILEITQYYAKLIDQLTADNEYIKQNLQESTMSELFDLYDVNKDNYGDMTQQQQDILNNYLKNSKDLTNAAYDNLFNIYNENIENFKNMTDAEIDNLMKELIPGWDSAYQQMIDNLNAEGGFVPATEDAYEQASVAAEDYYNEVTELANQSNKANQEAIDTINEKREADEESLKIANEQMEKGKKYLKYLEDLIKVKEEDIKKTKAQTKAAYEYWQEQQRQAAEAAKKEADKKKEEAAKKAENSKATSPSKTSTKPSSSSSKSSGGGDGKLTVGDKATYTGKYYYDSRGTAPVGSKYSGVKNGVIVDRINNNAYGVHIKSADGKYNDLGWIKKSQLSGYDTGGYTGTWGNDGRLALLHQKELVLNSTDTQNMLDAVKVIRQITDSLGSNILNRLADINSVGIGDIVTGSNTLAQKVDIQANFPNVRNHNEIEEALNNLVNAAAHRVNSNKDRS